MNVKKVKQDFLAIYDRGPDAVYFSPGRVNLIGEHIDYNGGRVMPAAISVGTYFAIAKNDTNQLKIYSALFVEQLSVQLSELSKLTAIGGWIDYIAGMLQQLEDSSGRLVGVDILVGSDMPLNSGLSSSASFLVGFGFALSDFLGLDKEKVELAMAAKAVENDFIGVNCGIMDQIAVALGKADHCMVLDCDSLEYEMLPLNLAGHEIVIANSKVPRKLSESKYNLRRSECEQALAILQQDYRVKQLCDLSVEQVEACDGLQKHDVLRRRALHAASENARVQDSALALRAGKLIELGAFMNASHESLRDNFEVSCPELDILAETAQGIPGVLGSRMTGAGFGGCTVSIVATSAVPNFIDQLSSVYSTATPFEVKILRCSTSDGVKRLK